MLQKFEVDLDEGDLVQFTILKKEEIEKNLDGGKYKNLITAKLEVTQLCLEEAINERYKCE